MSAFVLKLVASLTMLIDHVGAVFAMPDYFRWIGRVAFPIYAYMIAQGCAQTKNINKYLFRLGIFALISQIPFDMAFHSWKGISPLNFLHSTNVFYTLFLGAACVAVYQKLQTKQRPWLALLPLPLLPAILLVNFMPEPISNYGLPIAAVVLGLYTAGALCFANLLPDAKEPPPVALWRKAVPLLAALPLLLAAEAFKSDYGMTGAALIFLLYLVGPQRKLARTLALAAGIFYLYGDNLIAKYYSEIGGRMVLVEQTLNWAALPYLLFALAAAVLVFFYNGKQGPRLKWFFYAFYPVHLAVLAGVWFLLQ